MITIIIADDHQVFRQGLKRLLADDCRFRLLGEANNGREALDIINELAPDVAVLDLAMPRPDGIEVAAQVRAGASGTKCIILTMKEELLAVRRALDAGAMGYLLKESAFEEIAEAMVKVAAGKLYLGVYQNSPHLLLSADRGRLTEREIEVLRQVALGKTSRQIADELFLSPRTVDTHRRNIMEKLEVHSSTALVNYARDLGLT